MTQITLIRPGQTDFDQQGRIQGTLDIPLNEAGRQETAELVAELQPLGLEVLYTSPCQSAQETAAVLGEGLDLKVKKLEQLQNLDHGLWQGMLIEEMKHKHPRVFRQLQDHPQNVCPPQGEVVDDAITRVQEAVQKLVKKHRDGKIGLIVPEPLAAIVRCVLTGHPLVELWRDLGHCSEFERIDVLNGIPAAAT